MRRILVVDNRTDHIDQLKNMLEPRYQLTVVADTEAAKKCFEEKKRKNYALILLNVEEPQVHGLEFLQYLNETGKTRFQTVMVMTDQENGRNMKELAQMGADEAVSFDLPEQFFCGRIEGAVRAGRRQESTELMQLWGKDQEDFVFENCIGAAMFLEYDGVRIRPVMINDLFYDTVNRDEEEYRKQCENLWDHMYPDDIGPYRKALSDALEKGSGVCYMHNYDSGQIFQVALRHVASGERGELLFALIDDVTENMNALTKAQVIEELPGMIVYDYDVQKDRMIINISNKHGMRTVVSDQLLHGDTMPDWLQPEYEINFRAEMREAVHKATSGQLDFKGRIESMQSQWYRAYYRSIADGEGRVFRLVGRLEEIDETHRSKNAYNNTNIYDKATRLLTYHALKEYISKYLGDKGCGTMFVIGIEELDSLIIQHGKEKIDEIIRGVSNSICKMFRDTDIIGRFGIGGFVIFLPEACSERLAHKKAKEILALLDKEKLKYMHRKEGERADTYIGISVEQEEGIDVGELLHRANAARWTARRRGKERFMLWSPSMQE